MKQSFSLVELMVVISIIAILASISLPLYSDFAVRAQLTEAVSLTEKIKANVQDYYNHTGRFPADNLQSASPPADKIIGNFVKNVSVHNGAIHVTMGNKVRDQLKGKVITIRPIVVIGSPESPISWIGGYDVPPEGMSAVGDNLTDIDPTYLPHRFRSSE